MQEAEKYSRYSFLLDKTAKRVKQYAKQRFRELGWTITIDQWAVLKQLHDKGEVNQRELATNTFKDHPTMTRIIDLLKDKGLIERKPHPADRRSFMIALTNDGNKLVNECLPEVQNIRMKAWENLSEKDFKEFKRILESIYENLS
ncbi:MarR family winged helix-turn-helix transcriptional regulator [Marivirga arenosa]|jgi:DNA-binding MarR family transcriptional regulator|uniref:MarR family transcriptional regulator n=1 Tax=Marivirga arenosa TaxID=3059076 RepID=A0AA52EXS3_9BACT|nr:MarR family transcriptional regulator [Marivirga sp. BKB1-2]WNB18590.1 MarR family transcriptional regulator [Marivirga sp. BKB1-2]